MSFDGGAVTGDALLWKRIGAGLGLGRVALGIVFWKAPIASVRVAGLDAVSAPSADWLARMTASRDVAIGAGTAVAAIRADSTSVERSAWYLAGAVADLGDAVSIRRGIRSGRLARLPALGASTGAAVAVLVGLAAVGHEVAVSRTAVSRTPAAAATRA